MKKLSPKDLRLVSGGIAAPKYLSISNVKDCLGSESKGSYSVRCIPQKQPESCPDSSWKQLQQIKKELSVCTIKA